MRVGEPAQPSRLRPGVQKMLSLAHTQLCLFLSLLDGARGWCGCRAGPGRALPARTPKFFTGPCAREPTGLSRGTRHDFRTHVAPGSAPTALPQVSCLAHLPLPPGGQPGLGAGRRLVPGPAQSSAHQTDQDVFSVSTCPSPRLRGSFPRTRLQSYPCVTPAVLTQGLKGAGYGPSRNYCVHSFIHSSLH